MYSETQETRYVKVKDRAGNGFVCPLDHLKGLDRVNEHELENCVEEDVAGRYAGQMTIVN